MYRNLHHDTSITPAQDAGAARRRPRIRRRAAIAAIGACVAATTAIAIGGAGANPRPVNHAGHVSAQQVQREMRALNAKGFVATSCTVGGTLMTNYSTNRSVLVKW